MPGAVLGAGLNKQTNKKRQERQAKLSDAPMSTTIGSARSGKQQLIN